MTPEEILEGNKLIADYNDYLNKERAGIYYYAMFHAYHNGNLKYHNSWEWLMPVVEKICELGFAVNICNSKGYVVSSVHEGRAMNGYVNPAIVHIDLSRQKESMITTVYLSVIEFIKWYNDNLAI